MTLETAWFRGFRFLALYVLAMKHFEELWEYAEKIATNYDSQDVKERIEKIKTDIDNLDAKGSQSENSLVFGRILLQLCGLSLAMNVNTFAALSKECKDVELSAMDEAE